MTQVLDTPSKLVISEAAKELGAMTPKLRLVDDGTHGGSWPSSSKRRGGRSCAVTTSRSPAGGSRRSNRCTKPLLG